MRHLKNLLLAAALLTSAEAFAIPSLKPETTPPAAEGPLATQDIGPVFAHPLPEEEAPPQAAKPAAPPAEAKQNVPNGILNLFQQEKQPEEEKNPLEEEAKREMQTADNGNTVNLGAPPAAGEGSNSVDIKPDGSNTLAQAAPKELDLGSSDLGNKDLPGILK